MTQEYLNPNEDNLEVEFLFPIDPSMAFSKVTVDFTLKDGSKKHIETQIQDKK